MEYFYLKKKLSKAKKQKVFNNVNSVLLSWLACNTQLLGLSEGGGSAPLHSLRVIKFNK